MMNLSKKKLTALVGAIVSLVIVIMEIMA